MSDTDIVEVATWRDTGVAIAATPVVAADWARRYLTPPNQFIAIPDYLGADFKPQWAAIPARTPKDEIRTAVNDKTGAIMYKYVTSGYVNRTLDKVFQGHNWGSEIISAEWVPLGSNREYRVELQIVGPGMFRPQIGVGSSVFHANNPQDTEAKTIAGAMTAALKNAAKALGIGRDLDEDDPAFTALQDSRLNTISTMFTRLGDKGLGDDAREVVRRLAPTALLEGGGLMVTAIDFDVLEKVQRELGVVAMKVVAPAAKAT